MVKYKGVPVELPINVSLRTFKEVVNIIGTNQVAVQEIINLIGRKLHANSKN